MINVFGPRPEELWTPQEQAAGYGFAGLPLGDDGVQFGLKALEKGQITPAQFVDLNAKVGGVDIDINPIPERLPATQPALDRAYKSGAINQGNNLDQVAIIDLRGPDPGAFHDAYRSWAIRARLEREQGHFKNHVIWFGHVALMGDPNYASDGIVAMDRWLAAVEADTSDKSLAEKIVANRPEDIQDKCSQVAGVEQVVRARASARVCENEQVQTRYGTPATVAGESIATDTNQCQLKPLRRSDYYPIGFTDEQWAQLEATFPTGVCDWSRPGVVAAGHDPVADLPGRRTETSSTAAVRWARRPPRRRFAAAAKAVRGKGRRPKRLVRERIAPWMPSSKTGVRGARPSTTSASTSSTAMREAGQCCCWSTATRSARSTGRRSGRS